MQELETLNPWDLPSVSIHRRSELPESPGVYFCLRKSAVLYIGMSMNLRARWSSNSHHRLNDVTKFGSVELSYLVLDLPEQDVKRAESLLIDRFQPKFNNARKVTRLPNLTPEETLATVRNLQKIAAGREADASRALLFEGVSDCYKYALELQKLRESAQTALSQMARWQEAFEVKASELQNDIKNGKSYDRARATVSIPSQDVRDLERLSFAFLKYSCWMLSALQANDYVESIEETYKGVTDRMSERSKELMSEGFLEARSDWMQWVFDLATDTMPELQYSSDNVD